MKTFQKVMFFATLALMVILLFSTVTPLQLVPFIVVAILMWFHIYEKKDFGVWIAVISVVMFFLNLSVASLLDVVYWILAFVAFIRK